MVVNAAHRLFGKYAVLVPAYEHLHIQGRLASQIPELLTELSSVTLLDSAGSSATLQYETP